MTEESIYALQFLESLLETTMRSGQFRNNPHARAACSECIACVACRVDALKTKMQNELNEMMEEMR